MSYDAGLKVGIDGEADFKNGLKSLNSEIKTVGTELRAVTKEFENNADSMEALTTKNKVLGKEIDLHKSKVELLSKEYKNQTDELKKLEQKLEDAKKAHGDDSEEVRKAQKEYETQAGKVRKLESDLGTATSTLNRYTKEMNINSQSVKDQTSDTGKLEKGLTDLKTEMGTLESDQKKLTSTFKLQRAELGLNITEAEKMELAQKQLKEQIELTDKVVGNLENQLEKSKKAYGENSTEVKELETKLNEAKTEVVQFKNKLDDIETGAKNAGDGLDKMNQNVKSITLFEMADALSEVSQKLIDLGQKSIDAFNEVDDGMDTIIKSTGASGDAAEKLEEIYKAVATNVTGSFEDIGGAIGEVSRRFNTTGDELQTMSEDFLKFAEITGVDATQGVQLVSRAMGDAGIDSSQYKAILDQLAKAAQVSGISVETLTESLTKYGAPMRALGFDTQESIAIFSSWESAGVNTEIAFSGMKKAISNWMSEGKDAKQEFSGFIAGVRDGSISAQEAMEVFGAKAGPDLVDAIQGGRFEFEDFLKVIENSSGTLDGTYDDLLDSGVEYEQSMKDLKIALSGFGEAILSAFAPLLQMVVPVVQAMADGFASLSQPVQTFIVSIGGLLIGFVALMPIVAIFAASFNTLAPIFAGITGSAGGLGGAMIALTGPIGIAIAAVAAIGAVIAGAWQNSETFRTSVGTAFESIKTTISDAFARISEAMAPALEAFQGFAVNVQPILQEIGDFLSIYIVPLVQQFIEAFVNGFAAIIVAIAPFIEAIGNLFSFIGNFVGMVFALFTGDWSTAWTFAQGMAQSAVDFLVNVFQGLDNWGRLIFQGIFDFIKSIWEGIFQKTNEIWTSITGFLQTAWQLIYDNTFGKITETANAIATKWQETKTDTATKWDAIKGDLATKWEEIKTNISAKVQEVFTNVSQKWQETQTDSNTKWGAIVTDLTTKVGEIFTNVTTKIQEIVEDLPGRWEDIKITAGKKWTEIYNNIKNAIVNLPGELNSIAVNMLTEMKNGIEATAKDVWGAMETLAGELLKKFKSALGINSPSKELFDIGKYMIQGLINGLNGDSLMTFVNNMVEEIKAAFAAGNFNLKAAIDFVGSGAAEFFKSIGVGGATVGDLTAPLSGDITSGFGYRDQPTAGASSDHPGIDIGAPAGTPVGAAGAGTVSYAGGDPEVGYGYHVIIDHGGGLETLYGHLQQVLVNVGDVVSKLQTIGLVGSTGISTGPHLHFGVYQDGVAIDPSALFGFNVGSRYIPQDMVAMIHEGEMIVPKSENPYANSGGQVMPGTTINQTVNNYSPAELSPAQTAKLNKRAWQELALGL